MFLLLRNNNLASMESFSYRSEILDYIQADMNHRKSDDEYDAIKLRKITRSVVVENQKPFYYSDDNRIFRIGNLSVMPTAEFYKEGRKFFDVASHNPIKLNWSVEAEFVEQNPSEDILCSANEKIASGASLRAAGF